MLLSFDWKKELITRIENIDNIKENLKDAYAELSIVKERDPICKTSGGGDKPVRSYNGNPAIRLSQREEELMKQIAEYKSIIRQHESGWRLLDEEERDILIKRYRLNYKLPAISNEKNMSISTVKRISSRALSKMESQMIKP